MKASDSRRGANPKAARPSIKQQSFRAGNAKSTPGSKSSSPAGKSGVLNRLQAPTSSRRAQQVPKSAEQQQQAERERKAEAARRAARDKVAKQQAQLWLALEHRTVTRLQAAYRGRKGRIRMAEQEKLRPGVREAIREQERQRIAERRAEEERKAREADERRQQLEREAAARAEREAMVAEQARIRADEALRVRERIHREQAEVEMARRAAWWAAGPVRLEVMPLQHSRYGGCRCTISVARIGPTAAELADAAATAIAEAAAADRADGVPPSEGGHTAERERAVAGSQGATAADASDDEAMAPFALGEEMAGLLELEGGGSISALEDDSAELERPPTEQELAERARADRIRELEAELEALSEQCAVMELRVRERGKTTGEQAYRNRQEFARLQEQRDEVLRSLQAEQQQQSEAAEGNCTSTQ